MLPNVLGTPAEPSHDVLAAFVHDEITRGVLNKVIGLDWPGGRVALGGLTEAVEYLKRDPSARYLVIDIEGLTDPLVSLEGLADVCAPGTVLVLIGDVNDVALYRMLRGAGVADYLTKPVSVDSLRAALAGVKRHEATPEPIKPAATQGKVIAVVGSRGGVGTTTVATSLAWILAQEYHQRTMLVDLDLHCGSAALALDAEASYGLCEALDTPSRIDSLFVSSAAASLTDTLYLLSSEQPFDDTTTIRPGAIERLANELRHGFERIVIDLPGKNLDTLRQGLAETNTLVIVTDMSLAGLRETGRLMAFTRGVAPAVKQIVVANRVGGARKGAVPRGEFEKSIGQPLAAMLPEDQRAVPAALNAGKALPSVAGNSKVTVALRALAAELSEASPAKPNVVTRLLATIKQKKQ